MVKEILMVLKGHVEDTYEVSRALKANGEEVEVHHGFTKIVLVAEDDDYVVKFPKKENVYYNYCEREAQIYKKAIKWGIAFLFAPTTKWGEIERGIPAYRQPKISEFGYRTKGEHINHPVLRKKVTRAIDESGYYSCSEDWFASVLKHYGEDNLKKLLLFLKTYKINDLRDENVGFKDGRPILVDYSGFHGGYASGRRNGNIRVAKK